MLPDQSTTSLKKLSIKQKNTLLILVLQQNLLENKVVMLLNKTQFVLFSFHISFLSSNISSALFCLRVVNMNSTLSFQHGFVGKSDNVYIKTSVSCVLTVLTVRKGIWNSITKLFPTLFKTFYLLTAGFPEAGVNLS